MRRFTFVIPISAKQYADAGRQLRDGVRKASPLALALIEQGTYRLSNYDPTRLKLIDRATGRRYSGAVPAVLADYLACFRQGVEVMEDQEFFLVLDIDRD